MYIRSIFHGGFVSLAVAITLIGCGGGGSSSSSSGSTISSSTLNANFQNAIIAEPTIENAQEVEETVVTTNPNDFNVYGISNVSQTQALNLGDLSKEVSKTTSKYVGMSNLNNYSLNEVVNESWSCTNGGTVSVSGNGTEASFVLSMTYNQCNESSFLYDGQISVSASGYVSSADDYQNLSLSFTKDFNMSYGSQTSSIKSGSYIDLEVTNFLDTGYGYYYPSKYKLSTTLIATSSNISYGIEDAIYNYDEDYANNETSVYITQGRFYADNLSFYVDYDETYNMSQTPFVYNYSNYGTFENGGEARFNMSNSGKMKIIIENNSPISYVDADGDGIYEIVENI